MLIAAGLVRPVNHYDESFYAHVCMNEFAVVYNILTISAAVAAYRYNFHFLSSDHLHKKVHNNSNIKKK